MTAPVITAFNPDYIKGLTHCDLKRYKSKIALIGFDPYELTSDDCSDDVALWPKITYNDRLDYFVHQTNFVSKESMKAFKSLEGHNFFTSGFVSTPVVKEVDANLVVVLSKVST